MRINLFNEVFQNQKPGRKIGRASGIKAYLFGISRGGRVAVEGLLREKSRENHSGAEGWFREQEVGGCQSVAVCSRTHCLY